MRDSVRTTFSSTTTPGRSRIKPCAISSIARRCPSSYRASRTRRRDVPGRNVGVELRERLESELNRALERIRRTGSGAASGSLPAVSREDPVVDDDLDAGLLNADLEISFASRSLLIERARRLAKALERLDHGDYGTCQECGRAIGPGRLRVMPEATTCVRCQESLERKGARGSRTEGADYGRASQGARQEA